MPLGEGLICLESAVDSAEGGGDVGKEGAAAAAAGLLLERLALVALELAEGGRLDGFANGSAVDTDVRVGCLRDPTPCVGGSTLLGVVVGRA